MAGNTAMTAVPLNRKTHNEGITVTFLSKQTLVLSVLASALLLATVLDTTMQAAAAKESTAKALTMEQRLERLEAAHEIQNVMSKYEYYHAAGMPDEIIALWAKKTPGVRIEINRGIYDGLKGVTTFTMGTAKKGVGQLHLHTLSTPVIEVAGDGKTAQAVWVSPGIETSPDNATWTWLKYGVDFVKEDGEWKFWHVHYYRIFSAAPGQSWTEVAPPTPKTAPDADRPATFHAGYTTTTVQENLPVPPVPYASWDESRSF